MRVMVAKGGMVVVVLEVGVEVMGVVGGRG